MVFRPPRARAASCTIAVLAALASGSPAAAEPLLMPGEIGVFADQGATKIYMQELGFQLYVIGRPDRLGWSRVQFALELDPPSAGPNFVLPQAGVVDHDPSILGFDLEILDPPRNAHGLVVLAVAFAFGYFPSVEHIRIVPRLPEDETPLVTSTASNSIPRPMNWRVPPWRRANDRMDQLTGPVLGISGPESAMLAMRTGGDRGDLATVGLHFVQPSMVVPDYDPYNKPYTPEWATSDITQECEAATYMDTRCFTVGWIETRVEWDPEVASFAAIRPGRGALDLSVTVLDHGPGFVHARVQGDRRIRYFNHVFDLDLALDGTKVVTDLRVGILEDGVIGSPGLTGGYGWHKPGRLLAGCETFDVLDDDTIDSGDTQALLALLTGALALDDDLLCRADVNLDGWLDLADAVGTAREAEGLDVGAEATSAAFVSWRAAEGLTLDWAGAAAAEAEFATSLAVGTPLIATSDQAEVSAYVASDGALRVAFARARARSVRMRVSAQGTTLNNAKLTAARAVDERGASIDVDAAIGSISFGRRAIKMGLGHPNPFNPSVRIDFAVHERTVATIEIVDTRGRRVRDLGARVLDPGPGSIHWDGRDDTGMTVASGVYRVRVRAGVELFERSVTLLK